MKIRFEMDKSKFDVKKFPKKAEENLLKLSTNKLESIITDKTPVDTGDLRSSWHYKIQKTQAKVYTSKAYAKYVDQGTGIFGPKGQPIYPKNSNVLRFKPKGNAYSDYVSNDGYVYVPSVQGQKPVHLVDKSLDELEKEIPKLALIAIEKAGRE